MRLGSRRSKIFYFVLSAIKDLLIGLHPPGKQIESHQNCSIYVKMVENMEVPPSRTFELSRK